MNPHDWLEATETEMINLNQVVIVRRSPDDTAHFSLTDGTKLYTRIPYADWLAHAFDYEMEPRHDPT